MKERGKFIVFEGVGGSGKTSQVTLAKNYLESQGRSVVETLEPGGIKEAEAIRALIFELRSKRLINPDHQMALFFAARHLWVDGVVAPNVNSGTDVLSGRSYPSTGAYQGYGEGGDMELIERWTHAVLREYKPDAILFLDISAETAQARRADKFEGDPFDQEKLEYFNKVVGGYRKMACENWSGVKWYIVNGEPCIEEVHQNIKKILDEIFSIHR